MIFENKYARVVDCEGLKYYPISDSQMILYVKKNTIKTKLLDSSNIFRCLPLKTEYLCDEILRIDDEFVCLCQSNSMSILKREKENL